MPLVIRDQEVERLVEEAARLLGEAPEETIRKALEMRLAHLGKPQGQAHLRRFLEEEIWPKMPAEVLGRGVSREEEDRLLGYGPQGY